MWNSFSNQKQKCSGADHPRLLPVVGIVQIQSRAVTEVFMEAPHALRDGLFETNQSRAPLKHFWGVKHRCAAAAAGPGLDDGRPKTITGKMMPVWKFHSHPVIRVCRPKEITGRRNRQERGCSGAALTETEAENGRF